MNQNKISSRAYKLIKAAAAMAAVPVVFIYIMIAKPDYYLMNGLAHVVLPVANWVGNVVTWPIRATGRAISNISELTNLKEENEKLKIELAQAIANKNNCDIAIAENKKLYNELGMIRAQPQTAIIADVVHDNKTLHHSNFLINRGAFDGIKKGMITVSTDGYMAGIVIDVAGDFSRVRALNDTDSNIAVRIVGTDVYGFLKGDGANIAKIGFFSNPEFKANKDMMLVTSNIGGILPNGILVGNMINEHDVSILQPAKISRVMVLEFDNENEYK